MKKPWLLSMVSLLPHSGCHGSSRTKKEYKWILSCGKKAKNVVTFDSVQIIDLVAKQGVMK